MYKKNSGFTLAELLIVVAIIAVLTAIAVPIFTEQLEKSREAADLSNARTAYAELMSAVITNDYETLFALSGENSLFYGNEVYEAVVPLKQQKDGWSLNAENLDIGGVPSFAWYGNGPVAGGNCHIIYDPENDYVGIYWDSIHYYEYNDYPSIDSVDSNPDGNPEELTDNNRTTAQNVSNGIIEVLETDISSGSRLDWVSVEVSPNGHCSFQTSGEPEGGLQSLIDKLVESGVIQKTPADQGTGFYHTVEYDGEDQYGYKIYITPDENGNLNQTHIYTGELGHGQYFE